VKKIEIFLMILISASSIGYTQNNAEWIKRDIQIESIMKSVLVHEGKHPVHNFLLYAKNVNDGFEYHKGVGIIGRNSAPIRNNFQFKTASITKTFVAVVVLQLVEEGKLNYNDKVYKYLLDIEFLNFDKFHILDGVEYAKEITVQHLLRHTSGIGDIFTDKETRFVLSVLLNKKKSYNEEQVVKKYFKYKLHKHPTNKPGEGFHYSDMNYMLLGFTIEQITGHSLAENIRKRILNPLNMQNTYFEYYEPEVGIKQQVDTYLNKLNITKKVNTSYEWAGGGLVSTVKELGTFIESLFTLKLFRHKETLDKMIDLKPAQEYGKDAGMGIFKYRINEEDYFGHGGYYGSLLVYGMKDRIIIAANIGQANAELDPQILMDSLVRTIKGSE